MATTATTTDHSPGRSLIAGQWAEGGGASFESFNPATGKPIREYRGCIADQADQAMRAAAEAYRTYRAAPPGRVAGLLRAIADEIEALGDELLETGDAETALGLKRMTGERARTCGQIRAFADLVDLSQWVDARIDTGEVDVRRMRRPLGPVVVFGASNFPFAFGAVGGDTASALAAGNPVVVKGHPSHPATNELFARAVRTALEKQKLPAGVFSMLQGADPALSKALVEHPLAEAVGFTGSQRVGRILHDLASGRPRPIPVFAEMGSVNPLFVLPAAMSARHAAIAEAVAGSVTLGAGQFCTQPGVIVTQAGDGQDAFVAALRDHLAQAPGAPLLNSGIYEGLADAVRRAAQFNDVTVLCGGKPGDAGPNRFPPTLLQTTAETFLADRALREEMFGPVAILVQCQGEQQVQQVAERLDGQLTATLHADAGDAEQAGALTTVLEDKAGRLIYNGVPTGVAVCHSMQHGGPYPASTSAGTTSVGTAAIERFTRAVCFQNYPQDLLPDALKNGNPLGITRLVNGELTASAIEGER